MGLTTTLNGANNFVTDQPDPESLEVLPMEIATLNDLMGQFFGVMTTMKVTSINGVIGKMDIGMMQVWILELLVVVNASQVSHADLIECKKDFK